MMAMGLLWMGLALLQALETQGQSQESPQEIPVQPDFLEDKFVGTWYSVGLASTFPWFLKKKAELMMCKTVLTPEADGTVNFTATFVRTGNLSQVKGSSGSGSGNRNSNNQCETRTSLLRKTQQPGHYVYKSIKWGSEHNIFVVETNYEEYSLLYTTKTKGNSNFNMATLYSRTKDVRPELKERFISFAKSHGFTEDTIVILPKTDQCINEN
ncbi:prostaglandin-H2 D-isomerase isoform X1 [Sarcophilus harrisii]|uniref:Prostaglandin-H2 D-isomerase n=1 Tax=Sarcophilus harrisii TaxID=9305 RepID=A0A7N4P6Y6_SARHA|nr:prostaglandin-H2 D-isomerase isoform X1 [Sarcophilus harrisii]XP_023350146.1 prostaglandin-H2 D-isomerase isoform X1 [Sarcophilus harrisii]